MSQFDKEITCRLCASQIEKEKSLDIFERKHPVILSSVGEMMLDCLFTEIQPESGYPEVVCQYCQLQLNVFYEFKRKVLEQHDKFTLFIQHHRKADLEEGMLQNSREEPPNESQDMIVKIEPYKDFESESDEVDYIAKNNFNSEFYIKKESTAHSHIDLNAESELDKCDDVEYLDETINSPSCSLGDNLEEQHLNTSDECISSISPDLSQHDAEEHLEESEYQVTIEYIDEDGVSELESSLLIKTDEVQRKVHHDDKQIKIPCEMCDQFVSLELMENHINGHTKCKFECSICHKRFTTQSQCTKHEFRHSNLRPLSCSLCDKTFKMQCDLRIHMNCHNDVRNYSCDICGKSFRMHSHMTNHRETHATANRLPCPECGQLFKTSVTLKSHIRQVHRDDHSNKCSLCDRTFYRRNKLEKHLLSHEKKARKLSMENK